MLQFKPALQYDIEELPTQKAPAYRPTPLPMPSLPPMARRHDVQATIPTKVMPAIPKPQQALPASPQRRYGTITQGIALVTVFLSALVACVVSLHHNKYDAHAWLALCATITLFVMLGTAWVVARRWRPAKPTKYEELAKQGRIRQL